MDEEEYVAPKILDDELLYRLYPHEQWRQFVLTTRPSLAGDSLAQGWWRHPKKMPGKWNIWVAWRRCQQTYRGEDGC